MALIFAQKKGAAPVRAAPVKLPWYLSVRRSKSMIVLCYAQRYDYLGIWCLAGQGARVNQAVLRRDQIYAGRKLPDNPSNL